MNTKKKIKKRNKSYIPAFLTSKSEKGIKTKISPANTVSITQIIQIADDTTPTKIATVHSEGKNI